MLSDELVECLCLIVLDGKRCQAADDIRFTAKVDGASNVCLMGEAVNIANGLPSSAGLFACVR